MKSKIQVLKILDSKTWTIWNKIKLEIPLVGNFRNSKTFGIKKNLIKNVIFQKFRKQKTSGIQKKIKKV